MIEKLKLIDVYEDESYITTDEDHRIISKMKKIHIGQRYPNQQELMDKINEIIDIINKKE